MQLFQLTKLQAPLKKHSSSTRLLVSCTALGRGYKHQPVEFVTRPATVPSADFTAHSRSSSPSHVKELQRCSARRSTVEDPPETMGSELERLITRTITGSERLQDLEDVLDQSGSSFNCIHASAAFVKAAKLAQDRPKQAVRLCSRLVHIWLESNSQSDERSAANVLWASSKLQISDPKLWRETLEAFIPRAGHAALQALSNVVYALALQASRNKGVVPGLSKQEVQHAVAGILEHIYVRVMHPMLEGVSPQDIANTLWAIGKLEYAADTDTLSALLRALVRPRLVESATPQQWTNSLYGLSQLMEVCELQEVISQPICARLLSESAMKKVANGNSQDVADTLLALGRLSDGHQPPISHSLAQQCGLRLLQGTGAADLSAWSPQHVCNSLWTCAKLQIRYKPFLDSVVVPTLRWLPRATSEDLKRAAWAFGTLRYYDLQFIHIVVERSQQHLNQSHASTQAAFAVGLAVVVSWSVARLDMQALAAEAVALVNSPVVMLQMQSRLSNDDASMLWQVHTWLLEHALLDRQGLSSCLTSEQLSVGRMVYEQQLASGGDSGAG